jgi:hypothetical protein
MAMIMPVTSSTLVAVFIPLAGTGDTAGGLNNGSVQSDFCGRGLLVAQSRYR